MFCEETDRERSERDVEDTCDATSFGQAATSVHPPSVLVDVPPTVPTGPRDGHVVPRPVVGHAHVGHVIVAGHVHDEAVTVGERQFVVSLGGRVRHRRTFATHIRQAWNP